MRPATPVNGQSTAVGMAIRKVKIEQVDPDRGVAIVSDKTGKVSEIPYRVQHGRGRLPKIGEVWYVDRTLGPWMFLYYVAAGDDDFKNFSEGIVVGDTSLDQSSAGVLRTDGAIIADTWHPAVFQNGWGNLDANWSQAGYRRNLDRTVSIRGVVSGGTYVSDTAIFTLPAGYRPTKGCIHLAAVGNYVNGSAMHSSVAILATGRVVVFQPNTAASVDWLGLDDIRFSLDA